MFICITTIVTFVTLSCKESPPAYNLTAVKDGNIEYLNTMPNVKYVGSSICKDCHSEIYETYQSSRKGRSFSKMDINNIIEQFPHDKPVYEKKKNFWYQMFQEGDKFYQREYRKDTEGEIIHERILEAQYIIGSGANLRMYFYSDNGMFYQLSLTWYTHEQRWKMSPGYKEFYNPRFLRFATKKCMSCHNAYMDISPTSEDHYTAPYKLGIDCERCHGPGELHVKVNKKEIPKLTNPLQRTIVNPAKLSPIRQLDTCRQCHLQGKAWVLNRAEKWNDFRPGMLLSENRTVFSGEKVENAAFKVANTAYRLSLSRCFQESHGATTCINCHNPHGKKPVSQIAFNRNNCFKCHTFESLPSVKSLYQHKKTDNCINCHMLKTGKENTLHGVENTDHWIKTHTTEEEINWAPFLSPDKLNSSEKLLPDLLIGKEDLPLQTGIAYFTYYTEENKKASYLDSSAAHLKNSINKGSEKGIAYFYLGKIDYF